jgi:AAA+ superfamily predicted ATPase
MEKEFTKSNDSRLHMMAGKKEKQINYDLIGMNSEVLMNELQWLRSLIKQRVGYMTDEDLNEYPLDLHPPEITNQETPYALFIEKFKLQPHERLLLIMALAPAYLPEVFGPLLEKERGFRIKYDEFGGITDNLNFQFLPSLKTLVYLIAGNNAILTGIYYTKFIEENILADEQIILFRSLGSDNDRIINHEIKLIPEYVAHLSRGKEALPAFNSDFPARLLASDFDWEDLVVSHYTKERLELIIDWVKYRTKIFERQGDAGKVKTGFPALFFGPPGTGKTMAASLIGKLTGRSVFQIDLSMVVSKYIGETEKNLGRLFDKAERKDWILFFDEADSLFGKRGQVKDAHDKYANQEMSYLLQRMEQFTGLTILATNFDQNLDPALTRRFQAKVFFPAPLKEERLTLWQKSIPRGYTYDPSILLDKVAERFEVTGANIANILKMCCVRSEKRGDGMIVLKDITDALKIEFSKENKTL